MSKRHLFSAASTTAVLALASAAAAAPAPLSPQVKQLISRMTLDEKLAMFIGKPAPVSIGEAGYAPGVPRLDVPPLRLVNGPTGIEDQFETTGLPVGIALAATFDQRLARRFGQVSGWDARATGADVVLGPQVDINRIPNWGRNVTAFSEDPLLAGRMGVAEISGIQATGTMATVKHFIGYSSNTPGGNETDISIDERTLHEIYLPGFEAALRAGVASSMIAYAHVNGFWSTENRYNLTQVQRDEIGWNGFSMSDWGAIHSTAPAFKAGMDMEMPGYGVLGQPNPRPHYFGDTLKTAIQAGEASEADVDRSVARILTQMQRFGMLAGGKRIPAPKAIDIPAEAAIARAIGADGAVLLKNDASALPLKGKALGSLAVIGATGGQVAVGPGNGRAFGFEAREISPLEALRRDGAKAVYAVGDDQTGLAVPASALKSDDGAAGLTRRPAAGPAGLDPALDFVGARALPAKTNATWTGTLTAPETGDYTLMVQSWGGSAVLKLDGKQVASSAKVPFHGAPKKWTSLLPTTDGLDNGQAPMKLEAGKTYKLAIEEMGDTDNPVQIRLAWVTPEARRKAVADAVAAARSADTVVMFAWGRSGELVNPEDNLLLPGGQNALIEAVAEANPNTVVVLNTGGPVRMPWLAKVKAVVEMWFPGQEGGWATADILTGKVNPGGKLPITFPRRFEETLVMEPGHPERYAGVGGKLAFTEGVFVGYRWYDDRKVEPLFPFGYGLSYTRFAYSGLKAAPGRGGVDVTFTVSNIGPVKGAEAPQVYIGAPAKAAVPMPPKALAGFDKIELAPGQAKTVTIHVPGRQFAYWSVERKAWVAADSVRPVYVGASSRDIRLSGTVAVAGRSTDTAAID
jgi:beta-glucosidase